jgi:hypothetical protein
VTSSPHLAFQRLRRRNLGQLPLIWHSSGCAAGTLASFAQPVQRAAAFGTGAGCGVFHSRARQVFGQRPARRLAPSGIRRFGRGGLLRLRRRGFGDLLLEITQDQFQLLDGRAQLLRRGTEPFA